MLRKISKGLEQTILAITIAGTIMITPTAFTKETNSNNEKQTAEQIQNTSADEEYKKAFTYFVVKSKGGDGGTKTLNLLLELHEKFPESIDAHILAANIYSIEKSKVDYDKAQALFDEVLLKDPKNITAFRGKGFAAHMKVFPTTREEVLDLTIPDQIPERFLKGEEEAIKNYDEALKINPNDFSANYNKAMSLQFLRKFEQAKYYFLKASQINLKMQSFIGKEPTLKEEGEVSYVCEPSGACATSALYKYIIDNYFSIVINNNKIVSAEPTQTYISNENDALAFCFLHLGTCFSSGKNIDTKKAIEYYDKAIKLNPNIYYCYNMKRMIHLFTDQIAEAEKDQADLEKMVNRINNLIIQSK